jgi:hypothetical protein
MAFDSTRRWALAGMFAAGVVAGLTMSGTVSALQGGISGATDPKALETLVAKDAIREQLFNYARGLDRMDKALALSVWHPDAVVNSGGKDMTGPQWIESAWRTHEKIHSHAHTMGNVQIKVNGDKAVSETYFIASLRAEPTADSSDTSLIRGRYNDRWSKRNGKWAMDYRRIIVDFRTNDVTTATKNPVSAGKRDRTDPSYGIYD